MKTVEIRGVILTEEQILDAYEELQEQAFEYPMWFKPTSKSSTLIVRFDSLTTATCVVEGGWYVGEIVLCTKPHTDSTAWQQVDEPKVYERCSEGYVADGHGFVFKEGKADYYDNFNLYPTKELAEKAAKLMKESNKIITACLLIDPDYEPDWNSDTETKYGVSFEHGRGAYQIDDWAYLDMSAAYVSTKEKAEEVVKLMTEWREL